MNANEKFSKENQNFARIINKIKKKKKTKKKNKSKKNNKTNKKKP